SAPAGILTEPRVPTAVILSPRTSTTESTTGDPPLPSTSVAPTIATTWSTLGRATSFTSGSGVFGVCLSPARWPNTPMVAISNATGVTSNDFFLCIHRLPGQVVRLQHLNLKGET